MRKAVVITAILVLIIIIGYFAWKMMTTNEFQKDCVESIEDQYEFSEKVLSGNEAACEGSQICIAAIRKNISICETENGTTKQSCLALVTRDPTYCEGNKDCLPFMTEQMYKELKKKCKLAGIISEAKITNNPKICNKATDKELCLEMMKKDRFSVYDLL